MVKKGKGKTEIPPPSTVPPKDGGGGKGKKGLKGSSQPSQQASSSAGEILPPPGPPKPTVKQLIGGSSWTGKLPVNLLSELCQKQKWDRPDYNTLKTPDGFSVMVTLSAKDPKTQEFTRLEPFRIPASHRHLILRDTAIEAKHAAATYALFRVCSMQNKHTVLPPDHKALWKDFQELKKQDVKEGKGWMYEADPFKTFNEREEAKAKAEKKRKEEAAAREKAKDMPGASGLTLGGNLMKGWSTAPKVEMGRQTRTQLERLLKKGIKWNVNAVQMSQQEKMTAVTELEKLGFRPSHVSEAVDYCKDQEETLEWLLIHVPEDDLPRWALPEKYAVGVSVASTDIKKEGIIKRLSQAGYSLELCTRIVTEVGSDEARAANALQALLFASGRDGEDDKDKDETPDFLDMGSPEEQWEEEVESLESMYGDKFQRPEKEVIQVPLDGVKNAGKPVADAYLQIRMAPTYPDSLILVIVASLPSYIKLSIIKKALGYIAEQIQDEPMKIYLVIDWVQQNINSIINNPGKLVEISAVSSAASEVKPVVQSATKRRQYQSVPKAIQWAENTRSRDQWRQRFENPALQKMVAQREKLPAWPVQERLVRTVRQNNVTIISGETGSGKSTQSVQFLLDDLYIRGLGDCANMIVTQPRRISALGLADRVADERCTRVGGEVGYTIRGESRRSKDTRITFVTTGVLLRRLQTSGGKVDDVVAALADVSHVVIDEVHERSLDTDFLLNLLREVLRTRKDMLKLVLMSATLDAATFKDYFTSEGLSVGTVEISGRTFPVDEFYLDDLVRLTGYTGGDTRELGVGDDAMGKMIQNLGLRINYRMLVEAVKYIDFELEYENKTGGILIFLPGVGEISRACRELSAFSSLHVLPLHASLETREQKRVFASPPPGKRKVVVATNVAETSITIDDIVAVIDSGKVKETSFDPQNNMRKLEETWASRAACKQRRGRAGRVQEGRCYKLYTKNREEQMAERPEPEIRRVPLEQLCLSVRAMGMKDVASFLSRSPTPPDTPAIDKALTLLRRMGAMDGDELTAMGQQLAMLPADMRCGKLMVFGAIFGCLDECVTMAAILSTRSPFLSPQEKRNEAKEARMAFYNGHGDLLTDLEAFHQWDAMMQDRLPQRQIRGFCEESFLSYNTLSDIASTRSQYYTALAEIGILPPSEASRESHRTTGSSPQLLRALIASAFTPQLARIQYPDKKFAASVSGAVELDPEAKMIRYFNQENGRVFVHPSSTLFDSQGFSGNAAYVAYFNIMATSKVFVRDLTRKYLSHFFFSPFHCHGGWFSLFAIFICDAKKQLAFNVYTLLLFSGPIELDTMGRGLLVDGWVRLRGWARVGVLVARLRGLVDDLIAEKVQSPGVDLGGSEVIRIVKKLIELDGLDA